MPCSEMKLNIYFTLYFFQMVNVTFFYLYFTTLYFYLISLHQEFFHPKHLQVSSTKLIARQLFLEPNSLSFVPSTYKSAPFHFYMENSIPLDNHQSLSLVRLTIILRQCDLSNLQCFLFIIILIIRVNSIY